jgi:tetratricopeptide (TPR) repeat protein
MDCRRSPRLARFFLLPGALLIVAGCVTQSHQLVTPPLPPQPPANVKREADLPKITPKASTCLAGAEFCHLEANAAKTTPAQREEYRERARKGYQQALAQDPKNVTALQGLARLYADMNDRDRAIATYQKALKLTPKDASLSCELGMAHARWKEFEPAITHLKTAFDLEPENSQCANLLGHCLARAGRYDEALAVFTKTVGEAKAHYNLARMLHHLRQEELSRQHLALALSADPQMAEARELLLQLSGTQPTEESPPAHRLPAANGK